MQEEALIDEGARTATALGRRSLFDLMSAEAEHVQLQLAEVNAWHDAWSAVGAR